MTDKYEALLNLPRREPQNRVRMPVGNRAAQFAPFAALTGLDGEMRECARLTDKKKELCELEQDELNRMIGNLAELLDRGEKPRVRVTHFMPDRKKTGGVYTDTVGVLRRIDEVFRVMIFKDAEPVKTDDITEIEIIGFDKNQNSESATP